MEIKVLNKKRLERLRHAKIKRGIFKAVLIIPVKAEPPHKTYDKIWAIPIKPPVLSCQGEIKRTTPTGNKMLPVINKQY